MIDEQLTLLRRKEIAGTIAVIGWGLGIFLGFLVEPEGFAILLMLVGWVSAVYWMALDARFRGLAPAGWVVFAIFLFPVALAIYLLTRPAAAIICSQCGAALSIPSSVCPNCGRPMSPVNRVFARMTDALAPGSLDRARRTARNMAISFIALVLVEWLIHDLLPGFLEGFGGFLAVISFAAYWVLVPWWVYLDASWRRMEGVPWALLTLLTNVFGLATYLVIRYPEPGACRQCGAYLTAGQKHCPHCGTPALLACPQCKAALRPEWAFCPSCSAQLTTPVTRATQPQPASFIEGMVADSSGNPISGAEVRIDSKSDGLSCLTDGSGRFRLNDLEPRPYVLLASAKGYEEEAKAYTPGTGQADFRLKTLQSSPPNRR